MTELLPCPFCGGEAELYSSIPTYDGFWCCICRDCGASTSFGSEAEAIEAWNTRAEDAATVEVAQRIQFLELECAKLQDELRKVLDGWKCETCHGESDLSEWVCSECQCWIPLGLTPENISHASEWRYCPHCGREVKAVKR